MKIDAKKSVACIGVAAIVGVGLRTLAIRWFMGPHGDLVQAVNRGSLIGLSEQQVVASYGPPDDAGHSGSAGAKILTYELGGGLSITVPQVYIEVDLKTGLVRFAEIQNF